jgi:dienelactone hydrolase
MRTAHLLDTGGPDMAPHTPQRSEGPSQAGALLETHRRRLSIWAFLIALLAVGGCGMLPRPEGLQPILRPHDAVYRPVGEGPFPAVILLHGCAGVRRKDVQWAEAFREQGYVALVVDSLSGRGIMSRDERRRICIGLDLWGSTRAGDLLASLAYLRSLPFVDAGRIGVVGWSHGAWAALDFLASASPEMVQGLRAVVAFYPYCGIASRARWRGFGVDVPVLMLLAETDSIVSTSTCLRLAEEQAKRGRPVIAKVYPEVGHVFDWRESAATLDARERVRAFLAERLKI